MSLLRHLPALLIGAAVGTAVYFLSKGEKDPRYEHIVGPEDVTELDDPETEDAEETEETETPSEPDVEPEQPATAAEPETAPAAQPAAPVQKGNDAPNVNPVAPGKKKKVPKTADGKLDVTKIADPADFGDWDEEGCQG